MRIFLAGLFIVALSYFIYQLSRPTSEPAPSPRVQSVQPMQQMQQTQPAQPAQPAPTVKTTEPSPVQPSPPPKITTVTHPLFKVAVEPTVFELSTGALVIWRNYAGQKPALVLLSSHPFLEPLPVAERNSIRNFIKTAPPDEIVRRSRNNAADTIFLPPQTVSAAIEAGWLGELIFVQPTTRELNKVSLTEFQQRAFVAGFLTEKEALTLKLKDGIISGTVRGIPFRCVHPDALPKIGRPVIVHVDLGYFKDLYVDDVKTPMYNLLYETARAVRDAGWNTLAATLSYSNQEAEFSLETRFMISNLATLLLHPELLEGGTPPSWQMRADARFANTMFAEEDAKELTVKAAETSPDDPDALYALSLQKFVELQPDEAFALLDQAVAIDPGYALAYIELADTAVETNRTKKAEELFNKAARFFPNNPFIRISLANLLIQSNRSAEALPLLHELQKLPWSSSYHPGIPKFLKDMEETAIEQMEKQKDVKPGS